MSRQHRNATQSPLLNLPVEIRNRTFDEVFSGNRIVIGQKWNPKTSGFWRGFSVRTVRHDDWTQPKAAQLLVYVPLVCHQIYVETHLRLVAESDVVFYNTGFGLAPHLSKLTTVQKGRITKTRIFSKEMVIKARDW